jgi:hypothetical protein
MLTKKHFPKGEPNKCMVQGFRSDSHELRSPYVFQSPKNKNFRLDKEQFRVYILHS